MTGKLKQILLFPTSPEAFHRARPLLQALRIIPTSNPKVQHENGRIFVSHPYASVGDLILLIPLLEKIASIWPEAEIDIAVPRGVAELLGEVPHLHCLLLNDFNLFQQGVTRWSRTLDRIFYRYRVVYRLLRFCHRQMRNRFYDLAIAPRWGSIATWPAVYLASMSGALRVIGYSGAVDGGSTAPDRLLTVAVPGGNNEHESARNLGLLIRADLVEKPFDTTEAVQRPIPSLLRLAQRENAASDLGLKRAGAYAVIAPGATAPFRTWPIESLARTVRDIHRKTGLRFYVVGGPGNAPQCEALATAVPDAAVSLAGRTSLLQLLPLLAAAQLFIGMDSGIAHMAGALAVPTVVISPFPLSSTVDHPNSPLRFRPCGPRVRVLQPAFPLPPCDPTCSYPGPHCIEQITPADVIRTASELMQSSALDSPEALA
jgi:ADP-heptose:LPS heptosyltransferase